MIASIRPGSRVTLHYTLSLKDGTVVDSTAGAEPATFTVSSGELVDVLEARLLGLTAGERCHFELAAGDTGGMPEADCLQRLPRTDFPADLGLEPGQVIGFTLPDGQELPGQVMAVTDDEVTIDFSHPLAGRDLVFDVDILAVEPAEETGA
jgi:FKBP-type peptidyl-prolyl cis-trans isomerase SlpA